MSILDVLLYAIFILATSTAFIFAHKKKPVGALVSALVGFCAMAAYFFPWLMDDTYISLRYASNIANGFGPTFNPGLPPVEGYSNPIWTLLLSLPELLGVTGLYPAKALSLIAALLNFPLVYLITRRLFDDEESSLVSIIILTLSVPFIVWSIAGLETPFYSLLILAAFYTLLRDKLLLTGVLLGLVALTRPEGIIFVVPVIAYTIIENRPNLKRPLSIAAPLLVILFAYLAFRYFYFGDLLPNTYYAKTGAGLASVKVGILYFMRYAFFSALPLWIIMGLKSLSIKGTSKFVYVLVSSVILYFAFIVWAGWDLPSFRFFAGVIPLMAIIVAPGLTTFYNRIGKIAKIVTTALLILWSVATAYIVMNVDMYGTTNFGVGLQANGSGIRSSVVRIGRYLNDNAPSDSKLALIDAGIMPYYSELEIFDIWGLCDAEVAHLKYDAAKGRITTEELDNAVIKKFFDYDADYIALDVTGQDYEIAHEFAVRGEYAELNAHQQFHNLNKDPRFTKRYVLIESYPVTKEYSIFLFEKRDLNR